MAPNPAQSEVSLIVPDQVTGLNVTVYDITGKQVRNYDTQNDGSSKIRLNLDGISRGVYLVKATDGQHVFQSKLIVE